MSKSDVVAVRDLIPLLQNFGSPSALSAANAAARLGEVDLTLGMQKADSWANTLHLKYSIAQERGHEVVGLEELESRLRSTSAPVGAVAVPEEHGYFLVVLDADRANLVGMLHVVPSDTQP